MYLSGGYPGISLAEENLILDEIPSIPFVDYTLRDYVREDAKFELFSRCTLIKIKIWVLFFFLPLNPNLNRTVRG